MFLSVATRSWVWTLGGSPGGETSLRRRSDESVPNSTRAVELSEVTKALQQLDPVWEVLYPEEQSRVLELLVESVTVSKHSVDIHFRANGIEQIVDELTPMSERTDG
jgi:hypothetical protein